MARPSFQSTKIIATVGPSTRSLDSLLSLAQAGVDVFRLNFSHETHDSHMEVMNRIKYINKKHGYYLGILADLQGPKLRVGEIGPSGIELKTGEEILFSTKSSVSTPDRVYINYAPFASEMNVGDKVLIDDGMLELKVKASDGRQDVTLEIIHGGILHSRKGVNLPETELSIPSITPKDHRDLEFILKHPQVNWIALSFVRRAEEMIELQRLIDKAGHSAKTIAKIEKPQALKNIRKIVKASNAIMIARGDLGVEVAYEKLPAIQKTIINLCIQRARPVIVATQMMNHMIENPSPTRAEVADVASAVLDGTDAVMLSAETSIGKYPQKAVEAMARIIEETEKNYEIEGRRPKSNSKSATFYSDVVCIQAAKTAEEIKAKAITGITVSGYTAFKLSSFRPQPTICIFSREVHMLATMNLLWGVQCFYYDKFTSTDDTIADITTILQEEGIVKKGDVIVNTGTMPLKARATTNMMKVTFVK